MFNALEWGIAARYLRARREGFISVIAWLSLIGIALGVATLIIVMSVMNGFRAELVERILGIGGHVIVRGTTAGIPNFDEEIARIRGVPDVVRALPIVEGRVMVMSANGTASGALVRGVRLADLRQMPLINEGVVSGSLDAFGPPDSVVLGDRLALNLGVRVGDTVTFVAPETTPTPMGNVPRMKGYKVAATFDIGMYEYDSALAFLPLEAAQVFFRLADRVSAIEAIVTDPEQPDTVRAAIRQAVPGLRVFDWRDSNTQFFNALEVERNVMFLILTLIILVAALNVISGLIMLVKEKRGAIAIMRTMGASRGIILRVFFLAGASVGVIGTLAGFVLGLSFALNIETIRQWIESLTGTNLFAAEIYFLSTLPAKVDPSEVALVTGMALALSFLATLYPSWRAARTDPVEVLRSE
ncbi:MAG: lipoprotein-releasing ABC transporter permease subunit [Alphaproteobacteria bacterium]|nr:lipoprotein-releasing ABC transporter permease subunit [Alphaproteobacteria bacterium]